jgi:hypothetical protein
MSADQFRGPRAQADGPARRRRRGNDPTPIRASVDDDSARSQNVGNPTVDPAEHAAFLRYLYERDVEPKLQAMHPKRETADPGSGASVYATVVSATLDNLRIADRMLSEVDFSADVRSTPLRRELSTEMLEHAADGVRLHSGLLHEAGVVEVYDEYFEEMVAGLSARDLPPGEAEALAEHGFASTGRNVPGLVYEVRQRSLRRVRVSRVRVSAELAEVERRLATARSAPGKPKSRRWLKGLGQVVRGAAVSVVDLGLAAGLLQSGGPPMDGVGLFTSITTGVGTLLDGLGDIRAE